MGCSYACRFVSSTLSMDWNLHRFRMAFCMGGDVWHGDLASRIDYHDRSCYVDDEHASLPNPWPAHRSSGLGPPRRFDSARSRPDDDPAHRAGYTLAANCNHTLPYWFR